MELKDLFDRGEFVISGEVGPIKGAIPRDESFVPPCQKEAQELKGSVHAINVTDNQSAVMKLGSLAASVRLTAKGFEPIYQITCRERNRIALQSEILTAYSLGVDNMLLLTGDHTNLGDHKQAKPVFDLDSVQLVKIAAGLQAGRDMAGTPLMYTPDMFIGAVVNPNFQPLELQLLKMRKKMEPGTVDENRLGVRVVFVGAAPGHRSQSCYGGVGSSREDVAARCRSHRRKAARQVDGGTESIVSNSFSSPLEKGAGGG